MMDALDKEEIKSKVVKCVRARATGGGGQGAISLFFVMKNFFLIPVIYL